MLMVKREIDGQRCGGQGSVLWGLCALRAGGQRLLRLRVVSSNPQTPNPNPKPQTLNPKPHTVNPKAGPR